MLFLTVTLYFLLASLLIALVFFPTTREIATHALLKTGRVVKTRFSVIKNKKIHSLESFRDATVIPSLRTGRHLAKQYHWLFLAAAALLCFPPLLAWLISGKTMLNGFDVSTRDVNVQVADLLKGEHLVPPVALPPTVFITQEILQTHPLLGSANLFANNVNWVLTRYDGTVPVNSCALFAYDTDGNDSVDTVDRHLLAGRIAQHGDDVVDRACRRCGARLRSNLDHHAVAPSGPQERGRHVAHTA